jgi:hypothetical protein
MKYRRGHKVFLFRTPFRGYGVQFPAFFSLAGCTIAEETVFAQLKYRLRRKIRFEIKRSLRK